MPRSFIAIESNEKVRDSLKMIQGQLEKTGADLKTVKPENIHLTLKFLGDVSESKLDEVKKLLEDISKPDPFEMEINGLGIFPRPSFIRVIWAGVSNGSEEAKLLRRELDKRLRSLGFSEEDKDFTPHLTIARVKSGKAKEKLASIVKQESDTSFGKINVDKIKLKKSELTPEGPIYTDLQKVELG